MQYFLIIAVLISAGTSALFLLEGSDLLLIATLVVVIVGFIFGVSRIAAEKDK